MKRRLLLHVFCISALIAPSVARAQAVGSSSARAVAVTFDDLPVVSVEPRNIKTYREVTTKLLGSIASHNVPAIGFVNERKLLNDGVRDEARVALLRMWTDAGLELGNHSFSHHDLHSTPLATFQEDVVRGETETRALLQKSGWKLRYFRHPFLHTGRDIETKHAFEKFLAGRGYQIHPVTIDNMDWLYGKIYNDANRADDEERMQRVASEYVPYMEKMMEFYEQLSRDVLGYEVPQVLMLTGNALNAEKLDDLVAMLKRRGYTFITLEEALKDPAYSQPDTYTGPTGISWLQRWAITKGGEFRTEPYLSDFMSQFDPKKSGSDFKNRKGK